MKTFAFAFKNPHKCMRNFMLVEMNLGLWVGVWNDQIWHPLLHIVPFCEGPNKKSEGFAKEKQKT
jgi:hypothetical protein